MEETESMRALKEIVREKLDGLELRQLQRDAGRRCANQIKLIYAARKQHLLDSLEPAIDWLTNTGIHWSEENWYGISMIYAGGATLVYGPDGVLQRTYSPRLLGDEPEQFVLFTDETPTFYCDGEPC